jgi:AraC family ethanolamine operon transcriptional activator
MYARNGSQFRYAATIHHANDAWTHSRVDTGWSHVYEPLVSGRFEALTQQAWLGPIQVAYEFVGNGYSYRGHPWPGSRVFFSYISDDILHYYDCRPVRGNTVVSHRWDAVERVVCSRPTRLALVAIDESFLLERLSRHGPHFSTLPAVTSTSDPRRIGRFQACIMDVLRELKERPEAVKDPMTRAQFSGRIVDSLEVVISAATRGRRTLPSPTTRAYVVRRAMEIMEARIADAISVDELCAEIGVCARTLRYSFEEVTGVSPTQYLLSIRLNGARRELSANSCCPVQVVAARWGFSHMSRFARYYRLAFGERPSDTAIAPARHGRTRAENRRSASPSPSRFSLPSAR